MAGLLVVLALAAELLAGYLLLVVAVRLAAWLPGVPGALAARSAAWSRRAVSSVPPGRVDR